MKKRISAVALLGLLAISAVNCGGGGSGGSSERKFEQGYIPQPVVQTDRARVGSLNIGSDDQYLCLIMLDPETLTSQLFAYDGVSFTRLTSEGGVIPEPFTMYRGKTYFSYQGPEGQNLWVTDGTPEGTHITRDTIPGTVAYTHWISDMVGFEGRIFYEQAVLGDSDKLWATDGTEEGTVRASDLSPEVKAGREFGGVYEGHLYYRTEDDRIMVTDGSPEGTVEITSDPEVAARPLFKPLMMGGSLYEVACKSGIGCELWKNNAEGITLVSDFTPGPDSTPFNEGVVVQDKIFLRTINQLFVTDGTDSGINLLCSGDIVGGMTNFGNLLFFHVNEQPWVSDGTPEGTRKLNDALMMVGYSSQTGFIIYKDELYFTAEGSLWATDGTTYGTRRVKTINPYDYAPMLSSTIFQGLLYFGANDGINGKELWVTDGTEEGTHMVVDFSQNPEPYQNGFL